MQNQISEVEFDCYLEFALGYYKIIIVVKLRAKKKNKNYKRTKKKKTKQNKETEDIDINCTLVSPNLENHVQSFMHYEQFFFFVTRLGRG